MATVLTAGRWARLALLVCTLVGLAAMHTLGHGAHGAHGGGGHGGHDRAGPPDAHLAASSHAAATGDASAMTDVVGAAFPMVDAAVPVADVVGAALPVAALTGVAVPVVGEVGAASSVAEVGEGAVLRVGVTRVGAVRVLPEGCPMAGCSSTRLLPAGDPGAGPPGWSICLAVLGALAVALFVAVLLLSGVRAVGPSARRLGGPPAGPRAPPPRPIGLRLAETSVSRM